MLRFACGRSFGIDSPRYCYSVWLRHLKRIAAPRAALAPEFATMTDEDLGTSGMFVIAREPRYGGAA